MDGDTATTLNSLRPTLAANPKLDLHGAAANRTCLLQVLVVAIDAVRVVAVHPSCTSANAAGVSHGGMDENVQRTFANAGDP